MGVRPSTWPDSSSSSGFVARRKEGLRVLYALADESQGSARASNGVPPDSCAVRAVTDQFAVSPDKSFTSLLVEIAASDTLRTRKSGM